MGGTRRINKKEEKERKRSRKKRDNEEKKQWKKIRKRKRGKKKRKASGWSRAVHGAPTMAAALHSHKSPYRGVKRTRLPRIFPAAC